MAVPRDRRQRREHRPPGRRRCTHHVGSRTFDVALDGDQPCIHHRRRARSWQRLDLSRRGLQPSHRRRHQPRDARWSGRRVDLGTRTGLGDVRIHQSVLEPRRAGQPRRSKSDGRLLPRQPPLRRGSLLGFRCPGDPSRRARCFGRSHRSVRAAGALDAHHGCGVRRLLRGGL